MIIKGGTLITPFRRMCNTDVAFSGDTITAIGTNISDDEVFDASGCYVCPGLVDIHTHGGGGASLRIKVNEECVVPEIAECGGSVDG